MTDQQYPTPPQELLYKWDNLPLSTREIFVIAARWGFDQTETNIERERQEAADEELISILNWLVLNGYGHLHHKLRAARRPKSEKQQALEDLDGLEADLANYGMGFKTTNIRRALESISDPVVISTNGQTGHH